MQKVILYYTNNELEPSIMQAVQRQLVKVAGNIPIVCVTQQVMDFGSIPVNVGPLKKERRSITYQMQQGLLAAWREIQPDVVFCAEHDVLYPEGYFDFEPSEPYSYYYCPNKYYMTDAGFYQSDHPTLSTLCCRASLLLGHLTLRLYRTDKLGKKKGGWQVLEPGRRNDHSFGADAVMAPRQRPHIDIRHGLNLSKVDALSEKVMTSPYWGDHTKLKEYLGWI